MGRFDATTTIRLKSKDMERLKKIAASRNTSIATLTRQILKAGLRQVEAGADPTKIVLSDSEGQ